MGRILLQCLWALLCAGCSASLESQPASESSGTARVAGGCEWCQESVGLTGAPSDYDALLGAIGDDRIVALGENTHGTHEFYRERGRITERLVREKGFKALVIEGSWPETDRVNRYVRAIGNDTSAEQALAAYREFPRWMWRNAEFRDLIERLRSHNLSLPVAERVGVYGMDVYGFFDAIDAVHHYVGLRQPSLAEEVRQGYRCFARHGRSPEAYGAATRNPSRSCAVQAERVYQLLANVARPVDPNQREELFSAVRSAASVAGAEEYYRASFSGSNSWNVRDRRMVRTIHDIAGHVGSTSGEPGKVIVWAHNTHVGDARATDAANRGEVNVGQLLRESMGSSVYLVGLLTHRGTVVAASEWGAPGRSQTLRPALAESYSGVFEAAGLRNALLFPRATAGPDGPLLQRAVGVIYRPETERSSHYFRADLARQFDAVLFFAQSRSVDPL